METGEIISAIVAALEDVLRDKGIRPEMGPDFHLFGSGSVIDSLDLVAIVVRLEEVIRERTSQSVEIVDENSVITEDSPFRTVATLARYVKAKLER